MRSDALYARLFSISYEIVSGKTVSERMEHARELALRASRAAGSASAAVRERVLSDIERQHGMNAARRIRIVADEEAKRNAGRDSRFVSTGDLFCTIITSKTTRDEANSLYDRLVSAGKTTWLYFRSIPVGGNIRRRDLAALHAARYVAFLVSRAALTSNYVDFEIEVVHVLEMDDRRERLLPIVIGDLRYEELPPELRAARSIRWDEGGVDAVVTAVLERERADRAAVRVN